MIKRILPIAVLGAALISNTGCNNDGDFKKFKGIEYKIVSHGTGKQFLKVGDIVEFNILAKADTMVLGDSRKQQGGKPAVMQVSETTNSGQWQAVFTKLHVGDSAIVQISCDTILKNLPPSQTQLPPWLKKGNKITINLSVVSDKTKEDYQKEMAAKQAQDQADEKAAAAKQLPMDDQQLQAYFAKNNIKPQKTASGLYYTIQKPGSGPQIAKGQTVSVMYTGKTLAGKAFDSNVDTSIGHHGPSKPLVFKVGVGQMIPGMDEGIAQLKKGSKATLYLPSTLAYGSRAAGPDVGPNSILIFDVEVTDVKNVEDKPMAQGPPQQQ